MLRLGVIGFGGMGQWMAEAFSMLPDLKVVAIAEIAPEATRAAQMLGYHVFSDFRELLDLPLDGVYIASPNHLHKVHVLAAAERKLPLFVEKPLSITLADAEEMVSAVEAAGIPALVNFSYRFTPPYERMRSLYQSGALGELRACWTRSYRGYGFFTNGVAHPAVVHSVQSGGWVIHHAIHGVDWLTSIAGPVARLSAQVFASSLQSPCEEAVFAQFQFKNGSIGQLADSVCGYREHSAGLMGTLGTVVFGKDGFLRFTREPSQPETGQEIVSLADSEGYRHVAAQHFAAILRKETLPRATLMDGYRALFVSLAILESAHQGKTIEVNTTEESREKWQSFTST
jgi:predicted dehydrogenase